VNSVNDAKVFMMFCDTRFSSSDMENDENYVASGDVQILDMRGITMKHIRKTKLHVVQVYMKFLQKAFPMDLKAIHVINCPDSVGSIFMFVRPFLSRKVVQMVRII